MTDFRELTNVAPQIIELATAIKELAGEDNQTFVDTLEGESTVIGTARAAVRYIQANEALEEAAKALAARYLARAKTFSDRADRARDALSNFMSEIAAKSLVLPEGTVTLAVGQPTLVGDPDPATLPDDLVRITRAADKTKIKALLANNETVEGYSLSNARPRLQIRGGRSE